MQCFVFGLLGLIPVIGPAVRHCGALDFQAGCGSKKNKCGNAARPYRIRGVFYAAVGTIFWGFILTLIIYSAVSNSNGSGNHGYGGGGD